MTSLLVLRFDPTRSLKRKKGSATAEQGGGGAEWWKQDGDPAHARRDGETVSQNPAVSAEGLSLEWKNAEGVIHGEDASAGYSRHVEADTNTVALTKNQKKKLKKRKKLGIDDDDEFEGAAACGPTGGAPAVSAGVDAKTESAVDDAERGRGGTAARDSTANASSKEPEKASKTDLVRKATSRKINAGFAEAFRKEAVAPCMTVSGIENENSSSGVTSSSGRPAEAPVLGADSWFASLFGGAPSDATVSAEGRHTTAPSADASTSEKSSTCVGGDAKTSDSNDDVSLKWLDTWQPYQSFDSPEMLRHLEEYFLRNQKSVKKHIDSCVKSARRKARQRDGGNAFAKAFGERGLADD